jgi:hypothetical protein
MSVNHGQSPAPDGTTIVEGNEFCGSKMSSYARFQYRSQGAVKKLVA